MSLRVVLSVDVSRHAAARAVLVALTVAASGPLVTGAAAAEPAGEPARHPERVMQGLVTSGVHPDLGWSDFAAVRAEVEIFYARRAWRAAWFDGGMATPQAQAICGLLEAADRKGLDAGDYDGRAWCERLDRVALEHGAQRETTPPAVARMDVALTVSVARYASDLRGGRIDPRHVRFDLPAAPDRPPTSQLLETIAAAGDMRATIEALEPPFEPYRWTRTAMERSLDVAASRSPEAATAARTAAQLRLTLERWRWLPRKFGAPPVVVNIPEFRLHGTDPRRPLELRVVVGRSALPYRTPVFAADIEAVQFRPWWNVPRSIAARELAPKLAKNPAALEGESYEILDRSTGEAVALSSAALEGLKSGTLRIRQQPGPKNALGLVKFVMPNRYDVYLHGTPAVSLFAKPTRAASHGCIRVEHPEQLAAWVLRDEPGDWSAERIAAAMHGDRSFAVRLTRTVPVLVMYATATVDASGTVRLSPDLYGHDAALERALAERRRRAAPASKSPVANRPGVDVDEVGRGVIAHAAAAE